MNAQSGRVDGHPVSGVDPFGIEYLLDPYAHHDSLRDPGPVVWLDRWQVWAVARHEQVHAVLSDWKTFCSGAGVGYANFKTERPWRTPSLLLETDPPDHTANRAVLGRALAPANLRALRSRFEVEAARLVDDALGWGEFDAVPRFAEAFPLKVFADSVGVPPENRHHLVAYGNMVFNTMGPRNELFETAMCNAEEVIGWISHCCRRASLAPGSLGAQIYEAADAGSVNEHDAGLIVRSFLSAGIDTTAYAIANALALFAGHPAQWEMLRSDPAKVRSAFEEVMRYESPFQTFFRTAAHDAEIAGVPVRRDQKVLVSLGAANRDPRRWEEPDRFDISRKTTGHVGFGTGIHGCVGQMIARLEMEVLLTALAQRVREIEIAGEPRRQPHNTLRGFATLPVRLHA
jgi:cytochrome P450